MNSHKAGYIKKDFKEHVKACSSTSLGISTSRRITGGGAWDTRTKMQVVLCVVGTALFIAAFIAASALWYCVYVTHRGEILAYLHYMGPALLLSFVALCALTATLAGAIGTYIYISERSEAFRAKCLALSDKKHQFVSEERTAVNAGKAEEDTVRSNIPKRDCEHSEEDDAGVIPEHISIPTETSPTAGNGVNPAEKTLQAVGLKLDRLAIIASDMTTLLNSQEVGIVCPLGTQIESAKTGLVNAAAKGTCDATQLGMAEKMAALSRPVHARARSI